MKILFLAILVVSFLYSDEMQRIENIVNDISKLRVDYEECSKQLKLKESGVVSFKAVESNSDDLIDDLKHKLQDEKQKNSILNKELDNYKATSKKSTKVILKIEELEKVVKNQEKALKTKENIINTLEKENIKKVKAKDIEIISLKNRIKQLEVKPLHVEKKVVCKEKKKENAFPTLVMKEDVPPVSIKEERIEIEQEEAYAYRFKLDANIYTAIDGEKLFEWEKGTSFTSNRRTKEWVKITGYFVDKKWLSAENEMWVKAQEVIKR